MKLQKILLMMVPFALAPFAGVADDGPGSQPLIVGGTKVAKIEDAAYQVALVRAGTRSQFCGGTIISPTWIMTAAHCIDNPIVRKQPSRLDIVAGTLTFASGGKQVSVSEIHMHPGYNTSTLNNDAALLKLSEALPLGPTMQAIPLNSDASAPPVGINVTVTGWGATSSGGPGSATLLTVSVPVVATPTCNRRESYDGAITDVMFCAGQRDGGKDSCQGDSGGPNVIKLGATPTLMGIVSWGHGCALRLKYGVYTRVSTIYDWAKQTMGN